MKPTPTPITAALAGVFAAVVMPALWPRLGDDTLDWILAFLLVVALPAHALVVGFGPPRDPACRAGLDAALLKRVAAWLLAALATIAVRQALVT
ncbi:hypothetical protein [Pseudoxanthomonas sp. 10H]|uniref:hypothetical protein n=1 Tax=Pseudoxanthomonas sp. 10H TaxID=3242729 RepID=UPI0035568BBB